MVEHWIPNRDILGSITTGGTNQKYKVRFKHQKRKQSNCLALIQLKTNDDRFRLIFLLTFNIFDPFGLY